VCYAEMSEVEGNVGSGGGGEEAKVGIVEQQQQPAGSGDRPLRQGPSSTKKLRRSRSSSSSSSSGSSSTSSSSSSSSSSSDSSSDSEENDGFTSAVKKQKKKKKRVRSARQHRSGSNSQGEEDEEGVGLPRRDPGQRAQPPRQAPGPPQPPPQYDDRGMPVLDFLRQQLRVNDSRLREMFVTDHATVRNAIVGRMVAAYYGKAPIKFKCDEMSREGANKLPAFMNLPRGATVMNHLERNQKLKLEHPSYPCLIQYGGFVNKRRYDGEKHRSYFPIELMFMVQPTGVGHH